MCYFRERAKIEEKYRNDLIKKQEAELAKKDKDLAEKDRIIAELQAQLASQKQIYYTSNHYRPINQHSRRHP